MTTKDDPIVSRFFEEMKTKDSQVEVPDLMSLLIAKKRRRRRRLFIAAAASLTILLSVVWMNRPQTVQTEVNMVDLEQDIESMMSWESATGSLIENQ